MLVEWDTNEKLDDFFQKTSESFRTWKDRM